MRVLLDECIDSRLARYFGDVEVATVIGLGWGGISNGKLLGLAQVEFDAFVTVDRNLSFQQHLPKFELAVILLVTKSNDLDALLPFVPKVVEQLATAQKGAVTKISL